MKISIGRFDVNMDIKSKGIELKIWPPGKDAKHLGDLEITNTTIKWHSGRGRKNPKTISWNDFIDYMESRP